MVPGLVKELSDVIRSSGFFCLSALLSSTHELIVCKRVTSGLQDGGCSASYNYIQGRKQKGPGENAAAFLSGKKSISQKLHQKRTFHVSLARTERQRCKGDRESEGQAVGVGEGGQDARDILDEPWFTLGPGSIAT